MCILLSIFFFFWIGYCYHVIVSFCYKTTDSRKKKEEVMLVIFFFFLIQDRISTLA